MFPNKISVMLSGNEKYTSQILWYLETFGDLHVADDITEQLSRLRIARQVYYLISKENHLHLSTTPHENGELFNNIHDIIKYIAQTDEEKLNRLVDSLEFL